MAGHPASGPAVTAKNVSWNGTVTAGSSVAFGFTGSWSGTNTKPAAFTLGGGPARPADLAALVRGRFPWCPGGDGKDA
ncbi:cellulose binding domain-containing protein [Streptomyces olivaceoviridis]|uniref:cellulose binding domain-containing protein n=1 Tax=Streptomyces olivaceoviridis TaxID=1921 RepID=UPI0036FCFD4A